ncbi:MAG: DUF1700 domain-containing protein [Clostridia bacterium]|nr:DUF1700 domain-containing protein [Clostridia bacterium]
MTKAEFLSLLSEGLSGRMTDREINEHINFYKEAIDDRIEDGISEEDAVLDMGDIDRIIADIAGEPVKAKEKEKKKKKKKLKVWETVLLILGAPLWLSLLLSAFAIIISLIAVLWSLAVAFWAVFAAFAGSALGSFAAGTFFIIEGNLPSGLATIAAGAVLGGLSIFTFFASIAFTRAAAWISEKTTTGILSLFRKKEETE